MLPQKGKRLMAHTYSHLYKLPTTGLRFFTVYGPWGSLIWLYLYLQKNIKKRTHTNIQQWGYAERLHIHR